MRRTWVALGGALIAAALSIWAVSRIGDPAETEKGPPIVASEEAEPEIDDVDFDLDPEASSQDEDAPARRAAPSTESVEPPSSASTAIAAPSAGSAFVRGLLRDEMTEEPLPLYSLRIQDGSGRWEDILTDESGRFATGSPMVGETIRIIPFDDPSHRRKLPEIVVERRIDDGETRDLDLAVPCGPTYRLAISPGEVTPTSLVTRLKIRSADDDQYLGPETVRPGDSPWVRFPPAPRGFPRCERMEVFGQDGLWWGSAKATALVGVVPGIVEVVLEARAVLLGKVVDAYGAPIHRARVLLEEMAPTGKSRRVPIFTRRNGEYRLEHLFGGTGSVSVRSLRHDSQEASIRLPAGSVTRQDFILQPLPTPGVIRGRLESESGTYQAKLSVDLRPLDNPTLSTGTRVDWEDRDGRRVGIFEFEGLPVGVYELTVSDGSWFAWEPAKLNVSPPSEAARFLVRDGGLQADFAFRARDAQSGTELDGSFVSWNVRAARETPTNSKRLPFGERILTAFPVDGGFRWRLDRQGYQPAFGDEKAFEVEELREGHLWKFAEVELVPGWGEVFRVVREGNRKPLAGAKILLDGREAGTTKDDGTCTILARERPRRVEVVYRDWRTLSPVDMRAALRRKEKRFVTVPMAPPQP